jgi:hypothetical protein
MLALVIVAGLGLFGAAQITLAVFDRFDLGSGPLRVARASPGFDLFVALVLIAVATLVVFATWSDRKLRRQRIYALSDHRVFQAIEDRHARKTSVSTIFHRGQFEVTRHAKSVDIEVTIHGPCSEEPPRFGMYGLSPDDAETVLAILKQTRESAGV